MVSAGTRPMVGGALTRYCSGLVPAPTATQSALSNVLRQVSPGTTFVPEVAAEDVEMNWEVERRVASALTSQSGERG